MGRPDSEDGLGPATIPNGDNGTQGVISSAAPSSLASDEDTGRFSQVLYAAAQSGPVDPDEFLDALAAKLVKHGGGGDGGKPPDSYTKKERRTANLKITLGLLGALGSGIGGSFLAVKSMAEENHRGVQAIKEAAAAHADEPMHRKGTEEVQYIKARIGNIETEQKVQGRDIEYIKDGIDDLKEDLREDRRRRRRRD